MLTIYFKTDQWYEMEYDKFDLALNDTMQTISDPLAINTEYSKTMSFPLTAHNREVIDNYNLLSSLVTNRFDPTKVIPARIDVNGNIVFEGNFTLTKVDMKNNRIEGNFYSKINEFINKYKRLTWDILDGSDGSNAVLPDNFVVTKEKIFHSWARTPANRSQWTVLPGNQNYDWADWIGFAPTINGELKNFSSDKMFATSVSQGDQTFHPWEVVGFSGTELDIVKSIIEKPTERQMFQFRSYCQKPYVYVDNLFKHLVSYSQTSDLPEIEWDEDWANLDNPNWRNVIYLLPNLSVVDEDNKGNSTITKNLDNPLEISGSVHLDTSQASGSQDDMFFGGPFPITPATTAPGGTVIITSDGWINGAGNFDYTIPININAEFSYDIVINDGFLNELPSYWNRKMLLHGNIELVVGLVDQNNQQVFGSSQFVYTAPTWSPYDTTVTSEPVSGGGTKYTFKWQINADAIYTYHFTNPVGSKYRPMFKWQYTSSDAAWTGNTMCTLWTPDVTGMIGFQRTAIYNLVIPAWTSTNTVSYDVKSENTSNTLHQIITKISRNGKAYTMKDLWFKDENNTPFMVMLKYIKMFNLIFYYDQFADKIKIMPKEKFFAQGFNEGVEDWTNKVDYGRDMSFKPIAWDKKYVEMNYNDSDLDNIKTFKEKYGFNYGSKKIGTKCEYNNDTKKLLEDDQALKASAEMTEYMFNIYQLKQIASNPTATQAVEEAFLTKEAYMINRKDGKMADVNDCFAYRGDENVNWDEEINKLMNGTIHQRIYITDDCQYEINLGTFCYQPVFSSNVNWTYDASTNTMTSNDANCRALAMTTTGTKPKISHYCSKAINGTWIGYCCLFSVPRETYFNPSTAPIYANDIWTSRWRFLISEMYSEQNKLLTCYLYLTPEDYNNFKFNKFITIDSVLYLMNKIIDYNPDSLGPTKCELIQVYNPEMYTTTPDMTIR